MNSYSPAINGFIEDTCVLGMIAYLLARGRVLNWISEGRTDWRTSTILGILLGLVGLTEVIFPGARYPYVTHTLLITFASLVGGLRVGGIAALTVTIGMALYPMRPGVVETILTMATSVLIGCAVKSIFLRQNRMLTALAAGTSVQAGVLIIHHIPVGLLHVSHALSYPYISIPANGFGVVLLQLIVNEAQLRADSERNKIKAERAHTLISEAQFAALRARVKPHFLFNALSSISALCRISPDKAEDAIQNMSQLMRRALEAHTAETVPISEELRYVRAYLDIEQHRHGNHLEVIWRVETECLSTEIPAFGLQTLVENAIVHGIAKNLKAGTICIVVRSHNNRTFLAVQDDGPGMTVQQRVAALTVTPAASHGLQILTQQLGLLYGNRSRIRLHSREGSGAVAAFFVPANLIQRMKSS